jgi:endonuclease G
MRLLFILFLSLITFNLSAQKVDTVITTPIYTAGISYKLKQPLYVRYKLYGGGGDCSRKGMTFKTTAGLDLLSSKNYNGSGYDEGHLANAEDFAYQCLLQEQTFRYYNCLPQAPNLNRGSWKTTETVVRKLSQKDSLLIIAGGIWGKKPNVVNGMTIPDSCYKVVYSLSTRKLIFCYTFANKATGNLKNSVDVKSLEKRLGYKLK